MMNFKIRIKRKLSLFLSALMLVSSISSSTLPSQVVEVQAKDGIMTTMASNEEYSLVIEDETVIGYTGTPVDVVIPNGVKYIGYKAFYECKTIKTLTLGRDVIGVEGGSFGSSSIETVIMDYDLEYISDEAFFCCYGLKYAYLPKSVDIIGEKAFAYCNLEKIRWPERGKRIDNEAFYGDSKLEDLVIPEGVEEIGMASFGYLALVKSLVIPESVVDIDKRAFIGCSSLQKITLGSSVKYIGERCFAKCSDLESVYIYSTDVSLGYQCFEMCSPDITLYGFWDCKTRLRAELEGYVYKDLGQLPGVTTPEPTQGVATPAVETPSASTAEPTPVATPEPTPEITEVPTMKPTVTPTKSVDEYRFVYFSDSGYHIEPSMITVINGKPYGTLPAPTKTGYMFDGWYTEAVGGTCITSETIAQIEEPSQTLYARWKPVTYTITLDGNGGQCNTPSISLAYGNTYPILPTLSRDGYSFLGWFTAPRGGTKVNNGDSFYGSGDVTLYAHWKFDKVLSNDALSFQFDNSYEDFKHQTGYRIPYAIYQMMFGDNEYAKKMYENSGVWSGNCFGMSVGAALLFAEGVDPSISSFSESANMNKDLLLGDRNEEMNCSVEEYVEMLQISQSSCYIQNAMTQNMRDLKGMARQMEKVEENGQGLVVAMFGPEGGHSLVAYKLEGNKLYVYDPNFPLQERYITLYTDKLGNYNGWSYLVDDAYQWGSDKSVCTITYVDYQNFCRAWKERGIGDNNYNVLSISSSNAEILNAAGVLVAEVKDGELVTENTGVFEYREVSTNLEEKKKDRLLIYLSNDVYTVRNLDEGQEIFTAEMVNVNQKMTATTDAKELTIKVSDQTRDNSIVCEVGDGEKYSFVVDSSFKDDHAQVQLAGVGEETETVGLSQNAGVVKSMAGKTGVLYVDGEKVSTYNITAKGNEGGTITSDRSGLLEGNTQAITEGGSATYNITPKKGYVIGQVLVDGVSVGLCSSYVFKNVVADHTLEVVFKKASTSLKVGTSFEKSGLKYKVLANKKVSVSNATKKTVSSVTIPKTVEYKGTSYKVTQIGAKAFKDCKKLKTLVIKTTYLEKVGSKAFSGIHKNAVITVPKSKYKKYKKLLKGKGQKSTVKIKK